jgi:membrane protein
MHHFMRKNLHDIWSLLRFIAKRFQQDHCGQAAASLTFTTLLSLVPMITIALTIFSTFPVFDDFSMQIKSYLLDNMMPEKAGAIISHYVEQFAQSATRLKTFGIAFLAVTAMSMMMTIDKTFNVIWRASRPRPLVKRLVVYWAILTLAPLLIGASLSLTSWLIGLSMGYAQNISAFGVEALKILPTLFTTMAFALLYKLVPNRYVSSAHALIAAVVAAVLFEAMNRGFGHYLAHFPTYKLVYGAFASVPIFLMWIYMSWLIILFGAVIAASLSHWRMQDVENQPPIMDMLRSLQMLYILSQGLQQGRVTTFSDLSRKLRVGHDALEHMLDILQEANLVCKAEGQGWVMMRDAEHIRVVELLRLFTLDRHALSQFQQNDPMQEWLANSVEQMEKSMDISLLQLFEKCP